LEPSVTGQPLHTRSLTLVVSELGAGRVRALANVIDLRKSGFTPMFGDVQPAGLIHDMELDARVELATARLETLTTTQRRVAVEAAPITRGESCRDPAARLQALVGSAIGGPEFARALSAAQGGPRGCSHLLTLFQLVADALPRALERERGLRAQGAVRRQCESLFRRSLLLDGVRAGPRSLQLAVQLGDWHNAPDDGAGAPAERLVHVHEVRVLAQVDLGTGRVAEVRAAERERHRTWPDVRWVERSADAGTIVGQPILPGLGGYVLRRLTSPADRMLAHALLHLAPGFVQCTALFAERGPDGGRKDGPPLPVPVGGYADSCYMWRVQGPLIQLRSDRARSA
jgi:hypothetical protein